MFKTQRGNKSTTRPYRMISQDERRQILIELLRDKNCNVRQRHNISHQTVSHIRYHNMHLIQNVPSVIDQIRELKEKEMNSMEIAEKLGMTLEKVNALWIK